MVDIQLSLSGEKHSVTAKNILVGGWPFAFTDIPGAEHTITSNEIFICPNSPNGIVPVAGILPRNLLPSWTDSDRNALPPRTAVTVFAWF
jgi:hypothetical protein